MWGAWILLLMCVSLSRCQDQNVEYVEYIYDDYDYTEVAAQETKTSARQVSAPVAPPQLKPRRPGTAGSKKAHKPRGTTPVPIIRDIRRIDPVTGAFYYHYEGGDGSMKHEVRFPNGTVLGNYTYAKKNGELETHTYHHGLGSNIVDNDNGDYELHRHLEQGYVHQSGPDPVDTVDYIETLFQDDRPPQPNTVRVQSHRPIAQPRPAPRNRVRARPRPIAVQQAPSVFSAPQPVPLDYHDSQTAFSFQDDSRPIFNPNTVDVVGFQAQESSLQPVVEPVPQSYVDQPSEPQQVSEQ